MKEFRNYKMCFLKMVYLFLKSSLIQVIILFLLCFNIGSSQKGATPLTSHNSSLIASLNTYAVIVGISDYQSPQIPDLQYADRDAIAFSNWLMSPAGGKVQDENIILLVNDSATTARFTEALNWLIDQSKEGDRVVIYFSGHGDVESKLRDQLGFLLCFDSPARNYAAGSCAIDYLQSVIATITLDKKAKVLMITDACHAGKLAGSKINGSGITNANLAQQFANEVKILSCQQNEFSLEGKEWGNGRGVFSWVLIDGLNGLADANEDKSINLIEIGRYLEERVPVFTTPHQQIPITVGDRMALIANVDGTTKLEAIKEKSKESITFVPTNMRGLESGYISISDSIIQNKYKQFLAAIESNKLMTPKDSCANDLYQSLQNEKSLEPLHNLMRRNLAIALQDEVQQALNALLEDDPLEMNKWENHPDKYSEYPAYLTRAIELLGDKHYAYNSLKSKKLFFEGYLLSNISYGNNGTQIPNDSIRDMAKEKFSEAIKLEPNAAYLYHAIASLYRNQSPCLSDSVLFWNQKAMEIAPNWLRPIVESGFEFLLCESNACKTEPWIRKAYEERPESYIVQLYYSWLKQWQGEIVESKAINLRMIEQRPELFNAYATMAMTLSKIEGDYKNALAYGLQSLARDSTVVWVTEPMADAYINLGEYHSLFKLFNNPKFKQLTDNDPNCVSYFAEAYYYQKKYREGLNCIERLFKLKMIGATFYHVRMKFWEGRIYLDQGKIQKAKESFLQMFEMDKTTNGLFVWAYAWLAVCSLQENKIIEAESYFQKAVTYRFCGDGMDSPEPREEAHYLYARFLIEQNRMKEAEEQLVKAIDVRRMGYWGEYGMAIYFAKINSNEEALNYLQKALENSFPFYVKIMEEDAFQELKKTTDFKELIKNHFKSKNK